MRRAKDGQGTFEFQPATLKLTDEHHERYRRIDELLGDVPQILQRVELSRNGSWASINARELRREQLFSDGSTLLQTLATNACPKSRQKLSVGSRSVCSSAAARCSTPCPLPSPPASGRVWRRATGAALRSSVAR